jgi:hypothetical protein
MRAPAPDGLLYWCSGGDVFASTGTGATRFLTLDEARGVKAFVQLALARQTASDAATAYLRRAFTDLSNALLAASRWRAAA